jgi:hypothetical protein
MAWLDMSLPQTGLLLDARRPSKDSAGPSACGAERQQNPC